MNLSYCSFCKEVTPHTAIKVKDREVGTLSYCLYCGNPPTDKDGNKPVEPTPPPPPILAGNKEKMR